MMRFLHCANNFFNLHSHTKVCSQLMVFYVGCSSLMISGLYICLHRESLWFRMCRVSMIFLMSCHIYLRSPAWVENYVIMHSIFWGIRTCVPGRGSGCFATFRLSKWHMLSYDKMIFCQSVLDCFPNAAVNHVRTSRTPGQDLQIYANKKEIEDPVYT